MNTWHGKILVIWGHGGGQALAEEIGRKTGGGSGRNVHPEQRDGVVGAQAGWKRVEKQADRKEKGVEGSEADRRKGPVSSARKAEQSLSRAVPGLVTSQQPMGNKHWAQSQ